MILSMAFDNNEHRKVVHVNSNGNNVERVLNQ